MGCEFGDMPLNTHCVSCSSCQKLFHPETQCICVEEQVIAVLLEDKVGLFNFC